MAWLNEETGYFVGTPEEEGEAYTFHDCVPTAVANYLLLHGLPKETK